MACKSCEQRRVIMGIMAEATKLWMRNPLGPSIETIFARLRAEAIARGDLDASA
jgi:hypothetical protein